MLIFDFNVIGNKLYSFRKSMGMTQAEVAEAASVNMVRKGAIVWQKE